MWIVGAGLCALVLVAFANSIGGGLIFDNKVILLEDPRIRSLTLANLGEIFSRNYWWPYTETALYRPLTTLTYLFNYAVLGNATHPAGYHLFNLVLHAANALLVFAIGEKIARFWLAVAIAALWAVHPVVTEAVTNVVGRADLLAALGLLTSLWCHIRAERSRGTARTWWRTGVVAGAAIAMFSKETGIVLLAVLPLYDLLLGRRIERSVVTGWVLPVVPALLFLAARQAAIASSVIPIPFVDNPIVRADFWPARLTALAVVAKYLKLVVWPVTLSADYSFPQIPIASGTPSEWTAWAVVAAVTVVSLAALRINRALAFVVVAAFLVFLPASNLLFATGTIMAERLVYLPSVAVIATAVAGASTLISRVRQLAVPFAAASVILVVILTSLTIARNRAWHDEVSLWTDAVAASPRSFKTHGALAEALYQSDSSRTNLPAVIALKERSLELLSGLPEPSLVLEPYREAATYYLERGDWLEQHDSANGTGRRASYEAAAHWARVYSDVLDTARRSANPPNVKQLTEAQLLLSTTALRLSDPSTAVAAARRGRLSNPFAAAAYQAEAAAMLDARRTEDAAVTLLTGFMVTGDGSLRARAIDLYRSGLDQRGCAVRSGASGPVLDQDCEIVRRHICAASTEAIAIYDTAGRSELAQRARESARQEFHCAGF